MYWHKYCALYCYSSWCAVSELCLVGYGGTLVIMNEGVEYEGQTLNQGRERKEDDDDDDKIWIYICGTLRRQTRLWNRGRNEAKIFLGQSKSIVSSRSAWAPSLSLPQNFISNVVSQSWQTDVRTTVWLLVGFGNKWQQGQNALDKCVFLPFAPFPSPSFLSIL